MMNLTEAEAELLQLQNVARVYIAETRELIKLESHLTKVLI